MTDQEALDSWRAAIAVTTPLAAAAALANKSAHSAPGDIDAGLLAQETHAAALRALLQECVAGRRYLAARDASVAGQVTCSDVGSEMSHQARLEAALAELDTVVVDTTIRDRAWYWHADQANRHCGLALTAMREEH